eukprot:9496002-Pyramimonas_sp.AAC.1
MIDLFKDATTREDLVETGERMKPYKKAIAELATVASGVAKDLHSGITAARTRIQQEKDLAEQAESKAGRRRAPKSIPRASLLEQAGNGIFNHLPTNGLMEIATYTCEEFGGISHIGERPLVVSLRPDSDLYTALVSGAFKPSRQLFEQEWAHHPFRLSAGRAQKGVKAVSNSESTENSIFDKLAKVFFPDGNYS